MSGFRNLAVLLAAASVTACANSNLTSTKATTRFDTAPLGFSQNPKMTAKLTETYITNEAEVQAAAKRFKAKSFSSIVAEDAEDISARSSISLF